ncbi:hypothetical protein [Spirosoma utsteinense]|uniref:hypothetical protein n=1 Tax=Spirosoma utsteinense TaxID=2585773 RepID=UPI001EBFB6D0|nr:hypothetical protein [Spirosoma utsteinense]MBC3787752.1 hypothetical protein [Spirosoma utsteinense]
MIMRYGLTDVLRIDEYNVKLLMDLPPSHSKSIHYEPQQYTRLFDQLTQLIDTVPKLSTDRNAWDIEGEWTATGTIYFIDARQQPLFEPIRDFDCRSIKLLNPDRPAVRMTFYKKHRYWLLKPKDLPLTEKIAQIEAYIQVLENKSQLLTDKLGTLPASRRAEALANLLTGQQQMDQWQGILLAPHQYELALSNYGRQYFYVTLNYKYRLPTGDYTNEQEHLLNHQRDKHGLITQLPYNLIFVDTHEIGREHPYQNREVENYLATFPIQSVLGKHTLYARPRVDGASQEGL